MKTWIELSASALRENYRRIAEFVAPAQVMAVLKSDAYGHGLSQVGAILKDQVSSYAVDRVEEGIALRNVGVTGQILVLGYTENTEKITQAIEANLDLAISSFEQLEQLHFTTQDKGDTQPVHIHLEVETGLYRLGIPETDLGRVIELLQGQTRIQVRGLFTHFANVEEELDEGFPKEQHACFSRISEQFKAAGFSIPQQHMACSAAGLVFDASRFDCVRLGISLYGLWSSELVRERVQATPEFLGLRPVLTWKTIVAQVKSVPAGASIGYARSERTDRPTQIAILPIGYYDGYPRSLASKGVVVIQGVRCRVIGRICMNMCMVDVTHVPGPIAPGAEVTLIGPGIDAEELAALSGTIHYEFVTRLASTIPRLVVD
jgi:alanine racemase